MPRPPLKILAWKSTFGMLCGNFNQDLTAALTDRSSHCKYFLVVAYSTNWCYMASMRLLLRIINTAAGLEVLG